MSTTLVVRFVLGRYHATPWGRHVNEGQVELPPSPWRLLRALYAVWRTRVPDADEATIRAVFARLAEPPTFLVPAYQVSHTRHYYPDSKSRTGTPSVDRTLDSFAVLDPSAELGIRWPLTLAAEEQKELNRLVESLPYLGRADSICEARLDDDWEGGEHAVCGPLDIGESVPSNVEVVRLLAAKLPLDIEALTQRPVDVRAGKLLFPSATRFVGYASPPPAPRRAAPRRRIVPNRVCAVRYSLVDRVLPPIGQAVVVTERLRSAALSQLGKLRPDGRGQSLLAGKGVDGMPLHGHRHAHYFAVSDRDRCLAELVVWARDGLSEDEMVALSKVRHLWAPEDGPRPGSVELRMSAYGTAAAVLSDLVGPAWVWRTRTPLVPARNQKGEWSDFVAAEVRRELGFRSVDAKADIAIEDGDWARFVRRRPSRRRAKDKDGPATARGASVTLTFDKPVRGPLALGYLSHFGLGLFEPVT